MAFVDFKNYYTKKLKEISFFKKKVDHHTIIRVTQQRVLVIEKIITQQKKN